MAQTYAQLQDQIARLQAEAESVRKAEIAAVVARIREEVAAHGITPQDLFGKSVGRSAGARAKSPKAAKFADGKGNAWVGRGPRPQWLREALAAGKRLEEFIVGAVKAEPAAAPRRKPAAGKTAGRKSAAKRAPSKR